MMMLDKNELFTLAGNVLDATEQRMFLDRFPRARGAHVDDLLDILDNEDAYIGLIEQFHDEHGAEVPEPHYLNLATILACGIYGEQYVIWGTVRDLIGRIRRKVAEVEG